MGGHFFLTVEPEHEIDRRMSIYQPDDLTAYAEAFKALSNPNRLAIFLHLVSCCPPGTSCSYDEEMKKCVGDLGRGLNIGQPTISHHIKELRRAGLIHVEKKGKYTECWVDGETVRLLADILVGGVRIEDLTGSPLPQEAAGKQCPACTNNRRAS
jgi:ArsR family transcriptional regulator, arsenate/arsenite/antimonite-responsive transcriptional repressor